MKSFYLKYFSGHHLAILHTETKDQQYILATHSYQHNSLGITAVAYSHNKKLIAVAEKVQSCLRLREKILWTN